VSVRRTIYMAGLTYKPQLADRMQGPVRLLRLTAGRSSTTVSMNIDDNDKGKIKIQSSHFTLWRKNGAALHYVPLTRLCVTQNWSALHACTRHNSRHHNRPVAGRTLAHRELQTETLFASG